MALIALLSASDGARDRTAKDAAAPLIDLGGQPLVEYQARQAIAAGAEKLLIMVDAPAQDLAQLVDRLSVEQAVPVALVQDMMMLSREISLDDHVLMLSENLITPSETLGALLGLTGSALLALPSAPATAGFERLDSGAMWAGALCVPGANIVSTLDMLGDWDLELTLLRRAVQAGIARVELSAELVMDGRLTIVRDQASADLALRALSDRRRGGTTDRAGSIIGRLVAPLARPLVRELVRRQIEPGRLATIALVLAVVGLAMVGAAWTVPAFIVLLAAISGSDLARQCAQVTLRTSGAPWRHHLVLSAALGALAVLGFRLSQGGLLALAGAWLPVILIGLLAVAGETARPVRPLVRLTIAAALILTLIGLILGMAPAAFAFLGLLACIEIGIRLVPIGPAKV